MNDLIVETATTLEDLLQRVERGKVTKNVTRASTIKSLKAKALDPIQTRPGLNMSALAKRKEEIKLA